MYQVTIHHHKKAWRNGDLEDAFELERQENFKTRTAAKDWIERQLSRRSGIKYRDYHKGDKASYCYVYTGVKWQHENSGEEMEEYYEYKLSKVKLG